MSVLLHVPLELGCCIRGCISGRGSGLKRLLEICNDIVNMLDIDRYANQILGYVGTDLFLIRQLLVRRRPGSRSA